MKSTQSVYNVVYDVLTSSTTYAVSAIYAGMPPQKVAYPYAMLAITGNSETGADYDGNEYLATLELQTFNAPRTTAGATEDLADAAEAVLASYATVTDSGKLRVLRRTGRDMLPQWPSPADPNLVQVRQTWDIEVGVGWH